MAGIIIALLILIAVGVAVGVTIFFLYRRRETFILLFRTKNEENSNKIAMSEFTGNRNTDKRNDGNNNHFFYYPRQR